MKVALLMADGVRHDAVAHIPVVQELMRQCAYTLEATTVMPSVTLPCHLSLFLSVDPERHGTTTNVYAPQVRPVDGICEVLHHAGKSCAFFYNWEEFRDLTRPGSLDYSLFINAKEPTGLQVKDKTTTRALATNAIRYVKEHAPDFLWFYTMWPDHVGHHYYWMSREYVEAVERSYKEIVRIVRSLPEDYTVIIATDHGGHSGYHGTDTPEDMLIPLFIKGPNFAPGTQLPKDTNIKDIAPTITQLLGVAPNPEWKGTSLLRK